METFLLKLAVATIPLIMLVASVTLLSTLSVRHTRHPLSWHRKRRSIQR